MKQFFITWWFWIFLFGFEAVDFFYLTPKKREISYARGYTAAVSESTARLDSTTRLMLDADTTIRVYIEGKDTTYSITITK